MLCCAARTVTAEFLRVRACMCVVKTPRRQKQQREEESSSISGSISAESPQKFSVCRRGGVKAAVRICCRFGCPPGRSTGNHGQGKHAPVSPVKQHGCVRAAPSFTLCLQWWCGTWRQTVAACFSRTWRKPAAAQKPDEYQLKKKMFQDEAHVFRLGPSFIKMFYRWRRWHPGVGHLNSSSRNSIFVGFDYRNSQTGRSGFHIITCLNTNL